MGVSPGEYLSELRFGEACRLLRQTSLPVEAVARAVGMNQNAFFKFFRARLGLTPGEYRKREE